VELVQIKIKHIKIQIQMKTKTAYMTGSIIVLLVMIFSLSGFSTKWIVTVADFQFTPSSIPNVNVGDTIRWEWVNGTHTTTSTSVPAGAITWDQPIDASNTVYEYHATVTGTYNYHCMHHPSQMVASFTVTSFTPTLNVTPSNRNVTAAAGTTDFTVTSNTDWVAESNSIWCTVTPSGTGNGTLTANFTANSGVPRIDTITITVAGVTPRKVTVTQDGTTGVVINKTNTFHVYPNPTSGQLTIIPDVSQGKTDDLTVIDITGRTIFSDTIGSDQQYIIDLSSFPGGYYFVRVTSDNGIVTRKVILDK
jgi:plastocyanin